MRKILLVALNLIAMLAMASVAFAFSSLPMAISAFPSTTRTSVSLHLAAALVWALVCAAPATALPVILK